MGRHLRPQNKTHKQKMVLILKSENKVKNFRNWNLRPPSCPSNRVFWGQTSGSLVLLWGAKKGDFVHTWIYTYYTVYIEYYLWFTLLSYWTWSISQHLEHYLAYYIYMHPTNTFWMNEWTNEWTNEWAMDHKLPYLQNNNGTQTRAFLSQLLLILN